KQARPTQAEPEARREPDANSVCPHCGALKPAEGSRCESCGLDEFRPGERMQRNWASMWLMSQEQGLWPERSSDAPETTAALHDRGRGQSALGESLLGKSALEVAALDKTAAESKWTTEGAEHGGAEDVATEEYAPEDSELSVQPFPLSENYDSYSTGAGSA